MLQQLRVNLKPGIPGEVITRNVNHALSLGLPPLETGTESGPLAIIGGGPSLPLFQGGMPSMALNGACGVVRCDYAACYDPGEQNAQFFKGDLCRGQYLIGSRADPSVFETLKGRDVRLWHFADTYEASLDLRPRFRGGPSVGLTALVMAHQMGFEEFHLYGFDSCIIDGEHHAYSQPWNDVDSQRCLEIVVEGREFKAAPWHVKQMEFFQAIWRGFYLQGRKIKVYGDGLLAWTAELLAREVSEYRPARVQSRVVPEPEGGEHVDQGDDQTVAG